VPAIFCHAFFRNRLTRIAMDVSNVADDLLTQMYHNSKKAGVTADVPSSVKRPTAGPVPVAAPPNGGGAVTVTPAAIKPAE
jgi:biopolymer transport protein ExbB